MNLFRYSLYRPTYLAKKSMLPSTAQYYNVVGGWNEMTTVSIFWHSGWQCCGLFRCEKRLSSMLFAMIWIICKLNSVFFNGQFSSTNYCWCRTSLSLIHRFSSTWIFSSLTKLHVLQLSKSFTASKLLFDAPKFIFSWVEYTQFHWTSLAEEGDHLAILKSAKIHQGSNFK